MQKRDILLVLLLSILIIPITSAEISFSNPKETYNAGDEFSIDISFLSLEDASNFLQINIFCDSKSIEVQKSPLSVTKNLEKQITISTRLNPFLIQDLKGTCFIQASFNSEVRQSKKFIISRDISINVSLEKEAYNPGETIKITGTALKLDKSPINGIIEISSEKIQASKTLSFESGSFSVNYEIPEATEAGDHILTISVFEKTSKNETLNQGATALNLNVNQVPKSIDIVLNEQSIKPNNELRYKIFILDQTSKEISDSTNLQIINPRAEITFNEKIDSGKEISNKFQSDSIPGEWTLKALYKDKEIKKTFVVEEFKSLSYEIIEQELIITNNGNVFYDGEIKVIIDNKPTPIDIKLEVGKSKKYKLTAPNGEYQIQISDEKNTESVGTAVLSGRAISVDAITLGITSSKLRTILWLGIIIILAFILLYLYRKISKSSFIGKLPKFSSVKKKNYTDLSEQGIEKQETVSQGEKQQASLLVLKIKNLLEIKANKKAMQAINLALLKAKESRAKIYMSDNYRIIVLSRLLTSKNENELEAVKIAREIKEILEDYNKSESKKIKYGLGLHSGELIIESEQGKYKFTSLGKTISVAKNISESSNNEILVSEAFRVKILGKIRTEKVSPKLFKLLELKSKHKFEEFSKRFEQRREEEKKKS
mgnify:CR=1 FL=1